MRIKKKVIAILIILAFIITGIFAITNKTQELNKIELTAEDIRAMSYSPVVEEDKKTQSDCVEFNAFFLRDLDKDGYTEKYKGTCKEVGTKDTLYMELNVLTDGYLKDGKITINSNNFYFQTAIVKDKEIAKDYIGSNTKEIALNRIDNGTQKMIIGSVQSGDYSYSAGKLWAIKTIEDYSRINSITLTGTHIIENEDGTTTEVEINKIVEFNVDWYGEVDCSIPTYMDNSVKILNQSKKLEECLDEENNEVNLSFYVASRERKGELILKESNIQGEIPELNGYKPISVEVDERDITYTYDEESMKFIIKKEAKFNENGSITQNANTRSYKEDRYNYYKITVKYPLDAYTTMPTDTIEIKIPIEAYYVGYNNENEEFTNPYQSDIARDTIVINCSNPVGKVARFDVYTGEYTNKLGYHIFKEKPLNLYNGVSGSEEEDYYTVRWIATIGENVSGDGIIMKETKDGEAKVSDKFLLNNADEISMENVTKNVGIYFSSCEYILGKDGWIKVYDDDTDELIVTFTKENWYKYRPYYYEEGIKHIRLETSEVKN